MTLIEHGDLSMPDGADPITFLLSDGKLTKSLTISPATTLGQLCDRYLKELPEESMEANTIYTLKIHLAHLRRVFGDEFNVGQLEFADLQGYVDKRSAETGRRRKTVSAVTIKKELTSLSGAYASKSSREHFQKRRFAIPKLMRSDPFRPGPRSNDRSDSAGLQNIKKPSFGKVFISLPPKLNRSSISSRKTPLIRQCLQCSL